MNKELLAFEDIILYLNATEPEGLYCKNVETIKAGLERLSKQDVVLKVIKEKNVEIRPFREEFVEQNNDYRFYLENYDYYHYDNYEILTETEFNSLKEYFK